MRKRNQKPIASAKEGDQRILIDFNKINRDQAIQIDEDLPRGRKMYIYRRISKDEFEGMYGSTLIRWVAKTTLQRVKEICKKT